jgi:hypothetical protein
MPRLSRIPRGQYSGEEVTVEKTQCTGEMVVEGRSVHGAIDRAPRKMIRLYAILSKFFMYVRVYII